MKKIVSQDQSKRNGPLESQEKLRERAQEVGGGLKVDHDPFFDGIRSLFHSGKGE
jgi:hypothetical protein